MGESSADVSVQADAILAHGHNFAGIQPDNSAITIFVHVLREINFPSQSVIQRQSRSDSPGILDIEKFTVLPLGCICRIADVTLHAGDVAEQERCQWQPSAIRSSR